MAMNEQGHGREQEYDDEVNEWKKQVIFPYPDNDGIIISQHFLTSATATLQILDKFGTIFSPVKYDMSQNIEKIRKRFNEDPEKYLTIQKLVLLEREDGFNTATDALLWLTRALHFIESLIEQILADKDDENASQCLKKQFSNAYTVSVKKYHGWMTQKMFLLICKISPNRSQLITSLGISDDVQETYRFMDAFFKGLNRNRTEIQNFYAFQNLDDPSVV